MIELFDDNENDPEMNKIFYEMIKSVGVSKMSGDIFTPAHILAKNECQLMKNYKFIDELYTYYLFEHLLHELMNTFIDPLKDCRITINYIKTALEPTPNKVILASITTTRAMMLESSVQYLKDEIEFAGELIDFYETNPYDMTFDKEPPMPHNEMRIRSERPREGSMRAAGGCLIPIIIGIIILVNYIL